MAAPLFEFRCKPQIDHHEIEETRYVNPEQLEAVFGDSNAKIGPWFRLIKENFLNDIWKSLDNLELIEDGALHHMGEC